MIYFKNQTNDVFAYETQAERDQYGSADLVAMTQEQVDSHLNPQPTAEQVLAEQIAEAQAYLDRTDHKFYIGYVPKTDEDCGAIQVLRDEKREFIRANE